MINFSQKKGIFLYQQMLGSSLNRFINVYMDGIYKYIFKIDSNVTYKQQQNSRLYTYIYTHTNIYLYMCERL